MWDRSLFDHSVVRPGPTYLPWYVMMRSRWCLKDGNREPLLFWIRLIVGKKRNIQTHKCKLDLCTHNFWLKLGSLCCSGFEALSILFKTWPTVLNSCSIVLNSLEVVRIWTQVAFLRLCVLFFCPLSHCMAPLTSGGASGIALKTSPGRTSGTTRRVSMDSR